MAAMWWRAARWTATGGLRSASGRRPFILLSAGLVLATLAVYGQVAGFGFVSYDDYLSVADNPWVRSGLTLRGVAWAFTSLDLDYWIPLTWISHMLDYQFFGARPGAFHVTNVLLHVASTLLLFSLLRRMTAALWPSAAVAFLFACHPLHVESVAWVTERKDVLSGLFWHLTLLAYLAYARGPGRGRYLLALGCFAAGLMSKPMLVTLPAVLLLLDYWPLGRWRRSGGEGGIAPGGLLLEKVPFAALALLDGALIVVGQSRLGAIRSLEEFPPAVRLGNAALSYGWYVKKTLWPADLSFFYPHPGGAASPWAVAAALLFLAVATWAAVRLRPRRPYLLTGWAWYVVTLLPVIGIVQVGLVARTDRFSYLPLTGLFVAAAWGVAATLHGRRRGVAAAAALAGAVAVPTLIAAQVQVGTWRDDHALYRHALAVDADNWVAHLNLGVTLRAAGEQDQAFGHLRRAVEIQPTSAEAQDAFGNALLERGDLPGAERHYRQAIELDPLQGGFRYNLGVARALQGDPAGAEANYREAIRLRPGFADPWNNLGSLLARRGDYEGAARCFRVALRLRPELAEARKNLERVEGLLR